MHYFSFIGMLIYCWYNCLSIVYNRMGFVYVYIVYYTIVCLWYEMFWLVCCTFYFFMPLVSVCFNLLVCLSSTIFVGVYGRICWYFMLEFLSFFPLCVLLWLVCLVDSGFWRMLYLYVGVFCWSFSVGFYFVYELMYITISL